MNHRKELFDLKIRPTGKGGEIYGFYAEPGGSAATDREG